MKRKKKKNKTCSTKLEKSTLLNTDSSLGIYLKLSIFKLTIYIDKLKNEINDILKPLKSKSNIKSEDKQKSIKLNTYELFGSKSQINLKRKNEEVDFINLKGSTKHRKTEEGFTIYNEEELDIGKGKDTPMCPFDCKCCNTTEKSYHF
ncbi:hypothetical protein T552_01152 [Pneumocystis carinii B80]|uniref:DUF1764 domain-containing protein n=1 Tax=Pneumocystis carinii (strain B80) TaxID=1408658 RepID=A0A0W4ZLF3_PNEC8|nr:hypothetical protein T552_01152 [Pneumocystis carinii B80]KTW29196.1 hypothetical protein T552_01152 [Pneumocystis carinii B80]